MARKKLVASTSMSQKRAASNHRGATTVVPRAAIRIATVSHTLDVKLAERLREFAFRQRVSESAVIEHALRTFFEDGDDAELGQTLRKAGATLRRRI